MEECKGRAEAVAWIIICTHWRGPGH